MDQRVAPQSVAAGLIGMKIPDVILAATDGKLVNVGRIDGTNVIYCYPRTSAPSHAAIPGWDSIPGAKGCTPQSCGYRDMYVKLRQAGADRVIGVSTQNTSYQQEMRERLQLPFHLLSDMDLRLADALGLPTFDARGLNLLRRLTLIVRNHTVEHVFYPIETPSQNAQDVLEHLRSE